MEGLTPGEAQRIKDAFRLFDKSGDGRISRDEIGSVIRALGQNPTQALIDDYMKRADTDDDGYLTYEEFARLVDGEMQTPEQLNAELRQAFSRFDRNKDGTLDRKELFCVLTSIGEALTQDEANQILELADENGDGKLSADEFTKFLCERV